ncbi:MAG: PEP-CTERM sorting domain-containing protein [Pirellulales bacterium]
MPATTSGFYEAQAIFTTTPVALAAVNDSITLQYVFTDSANVLTGTGLSNSSALWTGLYNSASSLPLTTLANAGLTTTSTSGSILTAGVAPWQGFVMRIAATATNGAIGSSQLYTRPAQTTGTSSAVQELLGNNVGGGAYNGPAGFTIRTLSGSGSPTLTVGQQYTVDYTITLLGTGTLGITGNLFSGVGVAGPLLFTATGTASGANALTTSFDGLAIGYRYNGTSVASSLNVNSVAVTATLVPEPSTVALAGLGLASLVALWRRRGR